MIICLTLKADKQQYEYNSKYLNKYLYSINLVLSIIFCAISKCASEGQKLAFTKDWIVVMSNSDKTKTLSGLFLLA